MPGQHQYNRLVPVLSAMTKIKIRSKNLWLLICAKHQHKIPSYIGYTFGGIMIMILNYIIPRLISDTIFFMLHGTLFICLNHYFKLCAYCLCPRVHLYVSLWAKSIFALWMNTKLRKKYLRAIRSTFIHFLITFSCPACAQAAHLANTHATGTF